MLPALAVIHVLAWVKLSADSTLCDTPGTTIASCAGTAIGGGGPPAHREEG